MITRRTTIAGAVLSLLGPVPEATCAARTGTKLLVIGNGAFGGEFFSLPNPTRDARLVHETFRWLGYMCDELINVSRIQFFRSLYDFSSGIKHSEHPTRLVAYVASHGVSIDGDDYLLPVDSRIWRTKAEAMMHCIRVRDILDVLANSGAISVCVFFDACRNNPFSDANVEGVSRGLSQYEATDLSGPPEGVALSFSTQRGETAQDGEPGTNSPYSLALCNLLRSRQDLSTNDVIKRVRESVAVTTGGMQVPWSFSTLSENVRLLEPLER